MPVDRNLFADIMGGEAPSSRYHRRDTERSFVTDWLSRMTGRTRNRPRAQVT